MGALSHAGYAAAHPKPKEPKGLTTLTTDSELLTIIDTNGVQEN